MRFRDKHPEIDRIKLTDFRHMIEHKYGERLAKRPWLTATEGLPEILRHLEPLLSENK